ncbi:MAG TPA: hypothetical protein VFE47_25020 [Tepidisphaeraceae bacterium]|jgi:hypothetical protein|nr:hypothetical protein [Tepidisphaeraceae bacterium]
MRKFTSIASAAILAAATSVCVPSIARAADPATPAAKTSAKTTANADPVKVMPLAFPAGFEAKQMNKAENVQEAMASATQNALTSGDFGDFIGDLVDQDRTRIGKYKSSSKDQGELQGKINVIAKEWKAKYGHDFDIKKEKGLFQTPVVYIMTGEVSDSAQAAANWPLDPATGAAPRKSTEAVTAAAHEAGKLFGGKTDLDKGRNVALVRVDPSHGLPALTLSVIHELPNSWRFDIPNTRSGEQIYDDLVNQLDDVAKTSAQWPKTEADAYQLVAHRVLMAMYGVTQPESAHTAAAK